MNLIKFKSMNEIELKKMVSAIVDKVADGEVNPLELYLEAKALEKISKDVIKEIKSGATEEASDYSKIDSIINGAKFSISQSGTLLNYEDDMEYLKLKEAIEDRKSRLKEAFDLFHKSNAILYDRETGEEIPVVSIKKHGEQIIKVSFK